MKKLINGITNTVTDPIGRTTMVGYSTTLFLIAVGLILADFNSTKGTTILLVISFFTWVALWTWHDRRHEIAASNAALVGMIVGLAFGSLLLDAAATPPVPGDKIILALPVAMVGNYLVFTTGMQILHWGWGVEDPKR